MNINQLYSKKVLNYFLHPKNMGEIKNPSGVATVGNPVCGDVMQIFIKVGKENGKEIIKDAKFKTLGCAAAIATSGMVTEMVKGETLDEALTITNKAVAQALGGLPISKLHCSVLAAEGIKKAIENYKGKSK